jgi:hypothetical protein
LIHVIFSDRTVIDIILATPIFKGLGKPLHFLQIDFLGELLVENNRF